MRDVFGESGKSADLYRKYKLDSSGIYERILKFCNLPKLQGVVRIKPALNIQKCQNFNSNFFRTSHRKLAGGYCQRPGAKLSQMEVYCSRAEKRTRALETVRGVQCFVVQTATHRERRFDGAFCDYRRFEALIRKRIHVVMPHYAYARQDRVALPREPISAKLVADLCPQAGADHVIAVNLHSDQEQGFFDFPVDNLNCLKLFTDYFKEEIKKHYRLSPRCRWSERREKLADKLGATLAVIHKARPRRTSLMSRTLSVRSKAGHVFCMTT